MSILLGDEVRWACWLEGGWQSVLYYFGGFVFYSGVCMCVLFDLSLCHEEKRALRV